MLKKKLNYISFLEFMFLFYTFVLHFNIDRTRFGLNVPLQLSLNCFLYLAKRS